MYNLYLKYTFKKNTRALYSSGYTYYRYYNVNIYFIKILQRKYFKFNIFNRNSLIFSYY